MRFFLLLDFLAFLFGGLGIPVAVFFVEFGDFGFVIGPHTVAPVTIMTGGASQGDGLTLGELNGIALP